MPAWLTPHMLSLILPVTVWSAANAALAHSAPITAVQIMPFILSRFMATPCVGDANVTRFRIKQFSSVDLLHLMTGHRLRHAHVPHPPHGACRRSKAEEHMKGQGLIPVNRLQGIRHAVEAHVRADPSLKPTELKDVTYGTHRERKDRVFDISGGAFDDEIGLQQRGLDLQSFESTVKRIRADVAGGFYERGVARTAI